MDFVNGGGGDFVKGGHENMKVLAVFVIRLCLRLIASGASENKIW